MTGEESGWKILSVKNATKENVNQSIELDDVVIRKTKNLTAKIRNVNYEK